MKTNKIAREVNHLFQRAERELLRPDCGDELNCIHLAAKWIRSRRLFLAMIVLLLLGDFAIGWHLGDVAAEQRFFSEAGF